MACLTAFTTARHNPIPAVGGEVQEHELHLAALRRLQRSAVELKGTQGNAEALAQCGRCPQTAVGSAELHNVSDVVLGRDGCRDGCHDGCHGRCRGRNGCRYGGGRRMLLGNPRRSGTGERVGCRDVADAAAASGGAMGKNGGRWAGTDMVRCM